MTVLACKISSKELKENKGGQRESMKKKAAGFVFYNSSAPIIEQPAFFYGRALPG